MGEKIQLIELLSELVKGGVEIGEEEELKEVLMELEEEGNKHVEEGIEEEGEGEGEGEGDSKEGGGREREEGREEKKKREESEKKREKVEGEKRELEERIRRMGEEMEEMKKNGISQLPSTHTASTNRSSHKNPRPSKITSLDGTSVIFPQLDWISRQGDIIIHDSSHICRNCFVGGVMTSV